MAEDRLRWCGHACSVLLLPASCPVLLPTPFKEEGEEWGAEGRTPTMLRLCRWSRRWWWSLWPLLLALPGCCKVLLLLLEGCRCTAGRGGGRLCCGCCTVGGGGGRLCCGCCRCPA